MADLAYDPLSDTLYGSTTGINALYSINRATGAAMLITGTSVPLMHGLAFHRQDGFLYAVSVQTAGNDSLYRFDPATGHATFVGSLGFLPGDVLGLAFNPADSVLYGCLSGPSYKGGLVTINIVTGQAALLFSTQPLTDIAFQPETGIMFGIDNGVGLYPDALYTIDISTGAATRINYTGLDNELGLEFVPEPGTGALSLLGLFLMAAFKRDRFRSRKSVYQL